MCGCDYLDSISGIGPKKIFKLLGDNGPDITKVRKMAVVMMIVALMVLMLTSDFLCLARF